MRLVAEYLALNHRDHYYETRVRLGSLPASFNTDNLDDGEQKLIHSAYARWADAVVAMPDRTLLIEAKIVSHPSAVAQLMLYKRLLPSSPNLNLRAHMPIDLVLLYAREDPLVSQMAREQGISCVEYAPDWVDEYLATRYARQRTSPEPQILAS